MTLKTPAEFTWDARTALSNLLQVKVEVDPQFVPQTWKYGLAGEQPNSIPPSAVAANTFILQVPVPSAFQQTATAVRKDLLVEIKGTYAGAPHTVQLTTTLIYTPQAPRYSIEATVNPSSNIPQSDFKVTGVIKANGQAARIKAEWYIMYYGQSSAGANTQWRMPILNLGAGAAGRRTIVKDDGTCEFIISASNPFWSGASSNSVFVIVANPDGDPARRITSQQFRLSFAATSQSPTQPAAPAASQPQTQPVSPSVAPPPVVVNNAQGGAGGSAVVNNTQTGGNATAPAKQTKQSAPSKSRKSGSRRPVVRSAKNYSEILIMFAESIEGINEIIEKVYSSDRSIDLHQLELEDLDADDLLDLSKQSSAKIAAVMERITADFATELSALSNKAAVMKKLKASDVRASGITDVPAKFDAWFTLGLTALSNYKMLKN